MYCAYSDIEKILGKDELINLTNDVSEEVNVQIAYASEVIDNSLRGRYTLPLSKTYQELNSICIEIVVFNLLARKNLITDNTKYRYEAALKQLKSLKDGTASLDEPVSTQKGFFTVINRSNIDMETTYKQFREQF